MMRGKYNDPEYIGKQYGYLTVIGIEYNEAYKRYDWRCKCKCGKEVLEIPTNLVVSKRVKSCGCYRDGRKTGLTKKEYHNKYEKELRVWRKEHNLCQQCGEKDAYTMNGHYFCYECLKKKRKRKYEEVDFAKETLPKLLRAEWPDYGICYRCGKRPLKEGKSKYTDKPYRLCEKCYQDCLSMRRKWEEKYKDVVLYVHPPISKNPNSIRIYKEALEAKKHKKVEDGNER